MTRLTYHPSVVANAYLYAACGSVGHCTERQPWRPAPDLLAAVFDRVGNPGSGVAHYGLYLGIGKTDPP